MYLALLIVFGAVLFSSVCCNNVCVQKSEQCRSTEKFCDKMCKNGFCEIRAAVILPNDTEKHVASLPIVLPLLNQAIVDAKANNLIPPWLNIKLIPIDDRCEPSYAQIATINTYADRQEKCTHVIFGPVCDYCIATVSRIVQFFGTPLLTAGGFSSDFDKWKQECGQEYYMLIRTGLLNSRGLSQFFTKIALSYKWHKVAFLYDKQGQSEVAGPNTCSFMMQTLAQELKNTMEVKAQQFQYKDGDLGLSTFSIEEFLKEDIGANYGIIVMCASRDRIHEILLAAVSLNTMMYEGEYVFFNIELSSAAPDPNEPWKDPKYNYSVTHQLKDAYKNVIILTSFLDGINDNRSTGVGVKTKYSSGFYDAMMLYLNVLKDNLLEGGPAENENITLNGYSLVCQMHNRTFTGLNGAVEMNQNGDRKTHYSLLIYNPAKGKFDVVANYKKDADNFTIVDGKVNIWKLPMRDTPICGYDNSKCPDSIPHGLVSAILAVLLVVVVFVFVRIYKRKTEINNNKLFAKNWLIKSHEIRNLTTQDERMLDNASVVSILSGVELHMPLCIYKNIKVATKLITNITLDLNRQAHWPRLNQMLEIQHDNLVRFYGICESPTRFVLLEYCPRGSLQEILNTFKLNEKTSQLITMSFVMDIIQGMEYLHSSEIKSHGSLSSTNCVVDSRLMVKITDFGLHLLYEDKSSLEDGSYWKKKLWTAPELLRDENAPKNGTQRGDIYSFAIIFHEIIERKGTFFLGEDNHKTARDIVETVRSGIPFLRPLINETSGDKEVAELMRRSWAENSANRPDFPALKNIIRKLNKKHDTGNILDNLLSRLEQYANNLESLVEDRTADYLEEKKRCEELLYQLLPKSVASQLINGKSVIAETFNEVTICFSDIVGFTSLSALSSPLEVVDFLNELYTCFDSIIENFDVYKVETIGDSYMVVSGLPVRNDKFHAREIARMSIALLETVCSFKIKHRPNYQLKLRIGMHTGPCVAGVVGLKMPRYCLFGDTVNTASRMESNGKEQRIHVSPTTKVLLDYFGCFEMERRGEVDVKGKGKMITYWLNGEKPDLSKHLEHQIASTSREPTDILTTNIATNTSPYSTPAILPETQILSSTTLKTNSQTQPNIADQPKYGKRSRKSHLFPEFKNSSYFHNNLEDGNDNLSTACAAVPLLSDSLDSSV